MIEVWKRPPCLVCGAMYTPATPREDMCGACRTRGRLELARDPEAIDPWMRHMEADLRLAALRAYGTEAYLDRDILIIATDIMRINFP